MSSDIDPFWIGLYHMVPNGTGRHPAGPTYSAYFCGKILTENGSNGLLVPTSLCSRSHHLVFCCSLVWLVVWQVRSQPAQLRRGDPADAFPHVVVRPSSGLAAARLFRTTRALVGQIAVQVLPAKPCSCLATWGQHRPCCCAPRTATTSRSLHRSHSRCTVTTVAA